MMRRVFVAGHNGMVGRALCRHLSRQQDVCLVTAPREELDLTDQTKVDAFFAAQNIDEVYVAAAKVGGIHANATYPADFIHINLAIQTSIFAAALKYEVQRLLFLGSSCIYPKLAEQPMREDALLTSALEPSNAPYAVAKIAGLTMCEAFRRQYGMDFRAVMPTNLYGPFDSFHPENSHVIPALMRRIHEAKECDHKSVTIWGTGKPRREFLFVDDMAAACVFVMSLDKKDYDKHAPAPQAFVNVGVGEDVSIKEAAHLLADIIGYKGVFDFDTTKLDGTPRKLLDVSRLTKMGFVAPTELREGLERTYKWYLDNLARAHSR